jgi:hypothetical protein
MITFSAMSENPLLDWLCQLASGGPGILFIYLCIYLYIYILHMRMSNQICRTASQTNQRASTISPFPAWIPMSAGWYEYIYVCVYMWLWFIMFIYVTSNICIYIYKYTFNKSYDIYIIVCVCPYSFTQTCTGVNLWLAAGHELIEGDGTRLILNIGCDEDTFACSPGVHPGKLLLFPCS